MSKYNLYVKGEDGEDVSLEALLNIVGGVEGARRLQRGELKVVEVDPPSFSTWKTITVGTGPRTADEFRKALKDAGYKISSWAGNILNRVDFSEVNEAMELELVNASVAELGFKDGATLRDIYNRAQELGLSLCPAEVGPQLRLQYADQYEGEWFRIAMEPIADSGGCLNLFGVDHDSLDGRRLRSYHVGPYERLHSFYRFVLVHHKVSL